MTNLSVRHQNEKWICNYGSQTVSFDEAAAIQLRNIFVKELGSPTEQELVEAPKVA